MIYFGVVPPMAEKSVVHVARTPFVNIICCITSSACLQSLVTSII